MELFDAFLDICVLAVERGRRARSDRRESAAKSMNAAADLVARVIVGLIAVGAAGAIVLTLIRVLRII